MGCGQRNLEVLSPAHGVRINPVQDWGKAHDGWPIRRGPQCSTVSPVLSFSLRATGANGACRQFVYLKLLPLLIQ